MNILIIDDEYFICMDTKRVVSEVLIENFGQKDFSFSLAKSSVEALELLKHGEFDLIFSDVEMPGMKGIELADKIKEMAPDAKLIFVTGYPKYSLDAWNTMAIGFILKPVMRADVVKVLEKVLPTKPKDRSEYLILKCFGAFEVWYQGHEITFSRRKSLEMLAVLVDELGADTSIDRIRLRLWEEEEDTEEKKAYVRQLARDIRNTLGKMGMEDVLINTVGGYRLDKSRIRCDYFDWFSKEKENHSREVPRVYMSQYSWAKWKKHKV